jgi:hypothetical protein
MLEAALQQMDGIISGKWAVFYLRLCKWVPCHHSMALPQVADGGNSLRMWRVAANISNKESRIAGEGWSSSSGVGCGAVACRAWKQGKHCFRS